MSTDNSITAAITGLLDASSHTFTEADFRVAVTDPTELHWIGGISKRVNGGTFEPKLGTFWIPNPMVRDLRVGMPMWQWEVAKGVGADTIESLACSFAEIDDGTIPEQLIRIAKAVEAGLPMPTAMVMSGDDRHGGSPGKSIHMFWRYTSTLSLAMQDEWKIVQGALIETLGGDNSIRDIARRMRWGIPCSKQSGPKFITPNPKQYRYQTVLHVGDRVDFQSMQAWAATQLLSLEEEKRIVASQPYPISIVELDFSTSVLPPLTTNSRSNTPANNTAREVIDFSTVLVAGGLSLRSEALETFKHKDKHQVCCPFHTDHTASAFVRVAPNGVMFLHCVVEGKTWWDNTGATTPKATPRPVAPITGHVTYGAADLEGGKYFPNFKINTGRSIIGMRAPKGVGKTARLKEIVRMARSVKDVEGNQVVPIIVLTHRRELAKQLARRLNLPCYLDSKGKLETTPGVVVCYDSVTRIDTIKLRGWDVEPQKYMVIIDESEQVIRHTFGGTMTGPKSLESYSTVRDIIRDAQMVFLSDADLSDLSIDMVVEMRKADRNKDVILHDVVLPLKWQYRMTSDRAAMDARVFTAWGMGQRIVVPMVACDDSTMLAKQLMKRDPTRKVMLINQDMIKTKPVMDFLAAIASGGEVADLAIKGIDALVYSPSIGTGVSIDTTDHFDAIFCYAFAAITAEDVFQLVHRVRHPKSDRIDFWIQPSGQPKETDPHKIAKSLLTLTSKTAKEVRLHGGNTTLLLDYVVGSTARVEVGSETADARCQYHISPYDNHHFNLYCKVLAHERSHGGAGGNLREGMVSYLDGQDLTHPWIDLDDTNYLSPNQRDEVNGFRTEVREEAAKERGERVFNQVLRPIEAIKLIVEPADQVESDECEKARHHDFFGGGHHNVDTLVLDRKGKLKSAARKAASLALLQESEVRADEAKKRGGANLPPAGIKERLAVTQQDIRQMHADMPTSALTHVQQRSAAIYDILAWHGITDLSQHVTAVPVAVAEEATKRAWRNKALLESRGITVRGNAFKIEEPFRLLADTLKQLRIQIKRNKVEVGKTAAGKRIERCTSVNIKMETVKAIYELASVHKQRLLDHRVEEDSQPVVGEVDIEDLLLMVG